jgi:hypothetical protein
MEKPTLGLGEFAALSGTSLFAQSLGDHWQGTPQPSPGAPPTAKELRIVMRVATTDADMLKATLYSIDQGWSGYPGRRRNGAGEAVKITVPGIGGTYEGTFSADGNAIANRRQRLTAKVAACPMACLSPLCFNSRNVTPST